MQYCSEQDSSRGNSCSNTPSSRVGSTTGTPSRILNPLLPGSDGTPRSRSAVPPAGSTPTRRTASPHPWLTPTRTGAGSQLGRSLVDPQPAPTPPKMAPFRLGLTPNHLGLTPIRLSGTRNYSESTPLQHTPTKGQLNGLPDESRIHPAAASPGFTPCLVTPKKFVLSSGRNHGPGSPGWIQTFEDLIDKGGDRLIFCIAFFGVATICRYLWLLSFTV